MFRQLCHRLWFWLVLAVALVGVLWLAVSCNVQPPAAPPPPPPVPVATTSAAPPPPPVVPQKAPQTGDGSTVR